MFTLVLTTGQIAGALAAVGVLLLGIWKYVIQPARKVVKVYNSIGDNGTETVFDLLHGLNAKMNEWYAWRITVDDTLTYQNKTLQQQNRDLKAISVSVEQLLDTDNKGRA